MADAVSQKDSVVPLWTWQGIGFDITAGQISHEHYSAHYKIAGISAAYERLWERVHTRAIVWCCTVDGTYINAMADRKQWCLAVPVSQILCYIDEHVWDRIHKGSTSLTDAERTEFYDRGFRNNPRDPEALCDQETRRLNQPASVEQLWERLFVGRRADSCTSALLRHPIDRAFVV